MNKIFLDRLRAANLSSEVLVQIFLRLEQVLSEAGSGQAALTLGYVSPDDNIREGELIPTINLVLTQYGASNDKS
jgi:hypothetical protein